MLIDLLIDCWLEVLVDIFIMMFYFYFNGYCILEGCGFILVYYLDYCIIFNIDVNYI